MADKVGDPLRGLIHAFRNKQGRDQYLRGIREIGNAIGFSDYMTKKFAASGKLKLFKVGQISCARVEDITDFMLANNGPRVANTNPDGEVSKAIRTMPSEVRRKLIALWLRSDSEGMIEGAKLTKNEIHSLTEQRYALWRLAHSDYMLTSFGYAIVHALLVSDVWREGRKISHARKRKRKRAKKISILTSCLLEDLKSGPMTGTEVSDRGIAYRTLRYALQERLISVEDGGAGPRIFTATPRGLKALRDYKERHGIK